MNEEALQQLYTLAQGEGYSRSFDDFKVLMNSNEDALNNMYTVSQGEGYKNSIDDFKVLVGFGAQPDIAQEETITEDPLKKKEDTESVSADGLSESPKTDFLDFTQMSSSPMLEQAQQEEILQQKEQGVELSESPKFLEYQIDELEEKLGETLKKDVPATPKEREVKYDRFGDVMYDSAIGDELAIAATQVSNAFDAEPIQEEIKDLQLKLDGTKAGFRAQPSFKEVYQEAYDPETKTLDKQKLTEMGVEIPILFNNDFFQGMMGSNFSEARDLYNGYVEDYYDSKKEAAGYVYVNGEFVDPESPMPGYGFDAAMDAIKFGGIVSKEEEESVGRLNNMFNQYGFRFSQSGAKDNLTAVGPDGKQLKFFGEEELPLDNWTSATDKKYGAELKRVMANAYEAAEFTDEEMFKQAMTKPSDPTAIKNEAVAGIATRASSWSKQATSRINKDAKRLKDLLVLKNSQEILVDDAIKEANKIKQRDFKYGLWSSYEAEAEYNKLIKEANDIAEVYKVTFNAASRMDANLKSDVNQLTRYEGDRAMMMADMWDLNNVPALIAQSIGEGAGGLVSGVYGAADFAFSNIINLATGYDKTAAGYQTDEMQRERKASVSKQLREGLGSLATGGAITDAKTSAETIASIKSKSYLSEGGILGILMSVSESIPAMVSGMGAFGFAAYQMDGLANEMNNIPEFKNISENEKMLVLAPVAIVSGVLENFGFRNAMNKSSLVGRLTVGALKKFGAQTAKEGTKRTFKEIVERSVMNKISKGALLTAAGAAAEIETEAAQQFSETWMKEIYDLAKGQDFYKQSIDISKGEFFNMEFAKEIAKAGFAGMIGGAVIGAPSAYAGAVKNNSIVEISDAAFNLFTMTTTPESVERTLAVQRAAYNSMVGVETNPETGQKFTQKEVDDTLLQYEYLLGQKNEINSNWDAKSQKQVLALLMEKKNLEQSIEGLDKNTTKDQQREIEILKEDIEVISSAANKNYEQVLKKEYEKAKEEGFTGTIEAFKFRESVEKAAKEKQAPVKEEVAEETTVTEEVTEEAPVTEEERTAMQEAIETQPITKITTDLVAKEKKGELTQEETDGVLLGIMEKIEAENAKRKSPLSPEQAQKKLGKMQQRVFEGNKQRYLELSGVMPAAQEQVVEETPVVEQVTVKEAPVVEEEELEFGENTFVYKMRISTTPSGRGKWEADFEIVDNRPNEQGIRNDNSSDANWMVLNKITGEMLEATSKKDAQGIIKNAPAEAGIFGEGQQLDFTQLTPSQQKKLKKQFEAQKIERKRKKIGESFAKKLAAEEAVKKEAPPVVEKAPAKEAPKRKTRKKKPVVKETPVKEEPKKAPKKTTKKKAPKKQEAKISEEVQKEIKRAEGTRDSIVGPLKTKLDRTRGFEQKEEIRDEIRQVQKRYNNIITELKEGKRAQFQLESETTSEQTKQKLEDEAVKLLEDVTQENNGEISEDPFTAEQPAPGAEIITIEVKENSELAKKVKKMGLGDLVGKKISLVMADQLKVDKKRMGGPFFPLIDKLFGKVAWASMDNVAANKIITGAIDADYSVVFNMAPTAIFSNQAFREEFQNQTEALDASVQKEIFKALAEYIKSSRKYKLKNALKDSKSIADIVSALGQKIEKKSGDKKSLFSAKEKYEFFSAVLPNVEAPNTEIGRILKENNISIESILKPVSEQFVTGLPAGAMTMVLEVTDKAGNKITEETKDEALITPEQQREEGLPEHPNYPMYIRGKAVGILTETTPFWNMIEGVRDIINKKISGEIREKSGRKFTSKEARANAYYQGMVGASTAKEVSSPEASRYEKFVSVLKRSFPSVEVVTTQAEFDTLLRETGAKQLTTKGQKVYGAVYQGKLYLNPSLENYNTPIHEFGHVWMNVAKESNPELYKKGLSLVKGSKYEQDVLNNKAYQKVIKQMRKDGASEQEINDYIQEEALATAIGDKGESFVSASRNKSFKDWLSTLYGFVRKLTGISKYTSEQLEDITLDEFTQAVAVDLLSGRQLFEGAEITDMGDALQLMAEKGVDLDAAMNESINQMIDKGFKAAEIKGVLQQMGYKARAINDALVVKIDADMKLPNEFANIDGGVREGETMFRSVMQKLKEFAAPKLVKRSIKEQYKEAKKDGYEGTIKEYTEEQNNKKVEVLKQANPLLTLLTNEEILERYPNIQNEIVEKQQKSRAEIRAKAIELLEAEPAFKSQDALMQKELVVSMDRTMKTRSNKEVQKRISAIKQTLKGVREGVKDLQAAKKRIKNFINEELLPSGVSVREANKLVRIVEKATKETYESSVAEVMKVVEAQTSKKKKETINKMLKLAQQKSKVTNKRARTDTDARRFFEQAVVVLKALDSKGTESLEDIQSKLIKNEEKIYEILDALNDGLEVNETDRNLSALAQAFDILGSLNNQDLSQHEDALNLMKSELESGMESLRTRRAARKAIYDKLREEANKNIKEGYEFLFDENGRPLETTELDNLSDELKQEMWNNITSIPKLLSAVNKFTKLQAQKYGKFSMFFDSVKNLGTLLRGLDRKGKFFEKNVFDKLNNMEEEYLQGYFNTMDMLESELDAIGIKGGIDGLNKIINKEFVIAKTIDLKDIKLSLKKSARPVVKLTRGEAMRVYALSKNATQMSRLKDQGFTPAKMQQIEEFIGPQLVEATDVIVDFLSSSYYESINKVYEDVNDISLPYIENYFPTKTSPSKGSTAAEFDRLSKEINSGNFAGVFSAQQASALKERSSKDAIDIRYKDFSSVIEDHLRTMERFKAYAMGTKEINIIVNHTTSVKTLLAATRLNKTIENSIMSAINPDAVQQLFESSKGGKAFTFFQRQFTGITLALKPIQALKQMTSFINAWEDYSLRGKEKRIPVVDTVLDALGFSYDIAATFILLPKVWGKYSTYNKAMYSASFKDRVRQSFKTADLLGLEQGVGARRRSKKTRLGRAVRKAKVVSNSPTLVGDIAGVMGYMAAYRANMRNGMSQKEAIEMFNKYNETQQTRRGTDKVGLQANGSMYTRVFTMFGSSLFLQLNKVMQSVTKLRRGSIDSFKSAVKGDWKGTKENLPKEKDIRALYVNLAVANVLFAMMSNIFKYNPFMDDDDEELTEEEMERIKKAQNALNRGKEVSDEDMKLMERYQFKLDKEDVLKAYDNAKYGMNQLFNLPLVGPSLQQNWDYYYWNNPNAFSTDKKSRAVNPLEQTFSRNFWDRTLNDVSESESILKTIINFSLGVDVKRPLAMVEALQSYWGDDEMYREGYEELNDDGERKFKGTIEEYKAKKMEENMYELLGISYSYRPGSGKDWTKKKMTITIDPKKEEEEESSGRRKRRKPRTSSRRKRRKIRKN